MKTNKIDNELSEIIQSWKKNNVKGCEMDFSCGGDSMGDTQFNFLNKDNKIISSKDVSDLESYFDNEVYNQVEFYVNSDGHYVGESGTVYIELNEDEDGFNYSKNSSSEYSETHTEVVSMPLTKKEIKFIEEFVTNINGGTDGNMMIYKKDFILTDELLNIKEKLEKKVDDFMLEYDFSYIVVNGEFDDDNWFAYSTDIEDDGNTSENVVIEDGKMKARLSKNYTYFE